MLPILALPLLLPAPADLLDQVALELGFRPDRLLTLDVPGTVGEPLLVDLDLDGRSYLLDLRPFSVRASGFEVRAQDEFGWSRVDPGPVRTLRGELVGDPGSRVAGGLLDDGLHVRVELSSGEVLWIEPAVSFAQGASFQDYVVYGSSSDHGHGTCGVLEAPGYHEERGNKVLAPGETTWLAEYAADCDHQFYNAFGSVGATQARVELIINTMNAQYESELNLQHVITTILVRTSATNDPYTATDAGVLLGQFQSEWNANQSSVVRDVAELFTGKNMNGSTIGIAYLSVICNLTQAYNVVERLSGLGCSTDLSAHELGHNWSADHCSCPSNTMNPSLTCSNNFHDQLTVPDILAFRTKRNCLELSVEGTELFSDGFESGDYVAGGWVTFNNRSRVHGQAALDGSFGANLKKTTRIEKYVSTAGWANVALDFADRTKNYEAGEVLLVEWWDGAAWHTVTTLTDADLWQEHNFVLPAAAANNPNFGIRFKTNAHGKHSVTGLKKRGHVDEVRLIVWN